MASFEFEVIEKKFFTDYRNGSTFADNLTEFTGILQCNVGDRNKLTEIIQVTTQINLTESFEFTHTIGVGSNNKIQSAGFDFFENGLFPGAVIDVVQGSNVKEATVTSISGPGNTLMQITNANLAFLTAGTHINIIFKVKTQPKFFEYRYGIIDSFQETGTYESEFDDNIQSYYIFLIGGSFTAMTRIGADVSWDLTESVQVKFNVTTDIYTHEFEIAHIFSLKYFTEEELTAVLTNVKPTYLSGVNSVKYANGFFFGGVGSSLSLVFEDNGTDGKVGWFNEALNGFESLFSISDLTITNPSATGSIEDTETNSVEFTINSSTPVLTAASKVIVAHSKMADSVDYANLPDTNAAVFVRDLLSTTAGAGAVVSSIISNYTVTFVSTTELTINFDLDFNPTQQDFIETGDPFLLWASIGDEALNALDETPVNLLFTGVYSSNTDTPGLIIASAPLYFDAFAAYAGGRKFTDVNGWDGDLVGYQNPFTMTQFSDGSFTRVVAMRSVLKVINLTTGAEFEMFNNVVVFGEDEIITDGPSKFQALNFSTKFTTKIPPTSPINIVSVISSPPFPPLFQIINIQLAFARIPWRDWIPNAAVDAVFYDDTKPNNNQNEKTSNYNSTPPWEIVHQLEVDAIKNTPSTTTIEAFVATPVTTYILQSDHFDIQELGVDPGGIWTGILQAIDVLGEVTADIDSNFDMILRGTMNHSLGLLPVGDFWAMIWIVKDQSAETPWQLHSTEDWTHSQNPLAASDELATGNTTLVEILSEVDKVTVFCRTEHTNLIKGIQYKGYVRLGKKT